MAAPPLDDAALGQQLAAARPAARRREQVLARVRARLFAMPEPQDRIDRYVVEARLGEGGMGVVFAARDPRLARRVAIKLVRVDGPEQRARALREAQALARLAHPNVVEIFDVGRHEQGIFIAMELISGTTLARWQQSPRPWREILACYLAAAAGLVAAHTAGLVHRDFKPHNVMRGDDGRVRVMDFGLAQPPAPTQPDSAPAGVGLHAPRQVAITATGARVGTPAYMAPEQHAGREVDARSDQFGFCASLYEALAGVPAFAGDSLAALERAKLRGAISPPRADAGVPRAVLEVLRVGMAAAPEQRWPSMTALCDALLRAQRRGRSRWFAGGAAAALAAVAWVATRPSAADCEAATPWQPDATAVVEAAFAPVDRPWRDDVRTRVLASLQHHEQSWRAVAGTLCRAREAGEATPPGATACLTRTRTRRDALLGALASAQPEGLANAADAVDGLDPPAACLHATAPTIAAAPERVEPAAREALAEIWALQRLGRFDLAHARCDALARALEGVDAPVLHAELGVARANLLVDDGAYADAEASSSRAYFDALAADERTLAARAAIALVAITGVYGTRPDVALQWARHAEAALALAPDGVLQAELAINVGIVHNGRGETAAAQSSFRDAIAALREAEVDAAELASATQYLGISLLEEGRAQEARELLEQVVAMRERHLGPSHALVASARVNLANALLRVGALDEAALQHERALAIQLQVLGPAHLEVAVERNDYGSLLEATGDLTGARVQHALALSIFEPVLGDAHAYVGATLTNLGHVDVRLGLLATAAPELARGRAILEAALGREHAYVRFAQLATAELQLAQGDAAAALSELDGAPACPERQPLPCAELAFVRAQALARVGRCDEAIAAARAATSSAAVGYEATALRERVARWQLHPCAPDSGASAQRDQQRL
ncbi:MAG: serine/threonine-protein kinase [Nannocystaceae bacterium]|nr:serine/threonine-protein kinase [Nannocystaceae bacterium]